MSVSLNNLPVAVPGEAIDVIASQNGNAVRQRLPAAAQNPAANTQDMQSLDSSTAQVTPAAAGIVLRPLQSHTDTFWQAEASPVLQRRTPADKAAFSTVGIPLTTGNVKTATLSSNVAVFYDTATGVPVLTGDTIDLGVVFQNGLETSQLLNRYALVVYADAGVVVYRLVSNEWVKMEAEDTHWKFNKRAAVRNDGINPLHPDKVVTWSGLIRDTFHIFQDETNDVTYNNIERTRENFEALAANITGAQVKTALEGLSGGDRLDFSAVKNIPDGGSGNSIPSDDSVSSAKLQDGAVVNAKVADATLEVAKFSVAGGLSGQIVRNVNGVVKWSDEVADDLGEASVGAGSLQENIVALKHLDPTGGQPGQLYGLNASGEPAFLNVSGTGWERVANGVTFTTEASSSISVSLLTGKNISDYRDLFVWGGNLCSSLNVPVPIFKLSNGQSAFHIRYSGTDRISLHYSTETTILFGKTMTASLPTLFGIWGSR